MGGRGWDVANHMGRVWGGAVHSGGVTSLQCRPVRGGWKAGDVGVMGEEGRVRVGGVCQRGWGAGRQVSWWGRSFIRQVNERRRGRLIRVQKKR